jgi:hypothetical protein
MAFIHADFLSKLFFFDQTLPGWRAADQEHTAAWPCSGKHNLKSPTKIVGENSTNIVDCNLPQDTGGFNSYTKKPEMGKTMTESA